MRCKYIAKVFAIVVVVVAVVIAVGVVTAQRATQETASVRRKVFNSGPVIIHY